MQRSINLLINGLKWPVAVLTLFMLPGATSALGPVFAVLLDFPERTAPFVSGFIMYTLGWWFIFRKRSAGAYLSTLEHELTHALFALLTFHKVTGIKTSWSGKGSMHFQGGGNWLIMVAPYFVPTVSLAVMALMYFMEGGNSHALQVLLGATVCYHATSTWNETHRHQTDLQGVGFLFALLFLPAANVLSYGLILSVVVGGWPEGGAYLMAVLSSTWDLAANLIR